MAQPFDEPAGRLAGDAAPIVENVRYNPVTGRAAFSVSADGTLAYRTGENANGGTLTWFDRQGKRVGVVAESGTIDGFQISPDGRTVAVAQRDGSTADIWTIDLERNGRTRLTSDPSLALAPVWSADGGWIYFLSTRKGGNDLYRRASGAGGADEPAVRVARAHVSDQRLAGRKATIFAPLHGRAAG